MAKRPATSPATEPAPAPVKKSAIQELAESVDPGAVPDDDAGTPEPEITTTEPESTQQPAETEALPDFLDQVRQLGFEDITDENAARARLIEAYQQRSQELEARERRLKEVEPFVRYGQEHLDSLRQTKQPEQAQEQGWKWAPPKFDPAAARKYQVANPEGGWGWAQDTPAHVRTDFEASQAFYDKWANDIIYHPEEAFGPMIEAVAARYLERSLGVPVAELVERLDINGEQRTYDRLMAEHGDRIYAKDPITNKPNTQRLTPYGEALEAGIRRAAELGITSPAGRLEFAQAIAEQRHPAQTQATQQRQQQRQQVRQDVIRRSGATGLPQRGGSLQAEGKPQNPQLSPGHQLLNALDGIST